MAPVRKHGGHRYNLTSFTAAAGTAGTPEMFTFDAYAAGATTAASTGIAAYDASQETVSEMVLVLGTTLTGQATNFTTFRVSHYDSTGTVKNRISVSYSAAGVTSTAFVPINLAVASGATVPGAGTGTLAVANGTALPWTLAPGDTIALDSTVGGTGQYTGAWAITFLVGAKGA